MDHALILKPSLFEGAGVGCFAVNTIPAGVPVSLHSDKLQLLSRETIGEAYLKFCIFQGEDRYLSPSNFASMHMLWYVNHAKIPNLELRDRKLWTRTAINAGEELTLYYPDLLTHPINATWVRPEHI